MLRIILNSRLTLLVALALPGLAMLLGMIEAEASPGDLLHPSGETAARLMIVAIAINPLIAILGARRWLSWLAVRRRWIGVAAFAYACLHLIFYVIDMGELDDILAEVGAPGIWTAWTAMLLMVPLAVTSNDASMRWLKAGWKQVQRLVYPAALVTALHWIWVHNNLVPALAHFVPLAVLAIARLARPLLHKAVGA